MPLNLTIFAAEARSSVPFLHRQITKAHRLLDPPLKDLSLAILPAKEMSFLHRKFLGQSGPTDVLTFELEHDSTDRTVSGEIIVCSTIAKKRAAALAHPLAHELLLYAIHGLLHLSGFDDRTASAFVAMHAKEDEILTRIGIGPLFAPRTGGGKCRSI